MASESLDKQPAEGIGILTIPGELILHIWSFVDDSSSGPATPYILSAVCRQWRELALTYPVLWAKTLVTMEDVSPDLLVRLERSQGAPLAVRVIRFSSNALNALLEHSYRWGAVYIDRESFEQVTRMIHDLTLERGVPTLMPELKSLTLDLGFFMNDENIVLYPIWSTTLENLSVTCRTIYPFPALLTETLKTLSITCNRFGMDDLNLISSRCPNLVSLYVSAMMFEDAAKDQPEYHFSPLLSLSDASFKGTCKMGMLKAFCEATPNCKSLRFKPPPTRRNTFFSGFVVPFTSNVTTLRIDISLHNFDDVQRLFVACPMVTSLTVIGIKGISGLTDERPNASSILKHLYEPEIFPALRDVTLKFMDCRRDQIIDLAKRLAEGAKQNNRPASIRPRIIVTQCVGIADTTLTDPICEEVEIFVFNDAERQSLRVEAVDQVRMNVHEQLRQAILARKPVE